MTQRPEGEEQNTDTSGIKGLLGFSKKDVKTSSLLATPSQQSEFCSALFCTEVLATITHSLSQCYLFWNQSETKCSAGISVVLHLCSIRVRRQVAFWAGDDIPVSRLGCRSPGQVRGWQALSWQAGLRGLLSRFQQEPKVMLLIHIPNVQWAFFLADFPLSFWQIILLSAVMPQLWSDSPRARELGVLEGFGQH